MVSYVRRFGSRSHREKIESLLAAGRSRDSIVATLRCQPDIVRDIARHLHSERLMAEDMSGDDARHVGAVLAELPAGFPAYHLPAKVRIAA